MATAGSRCPRCGGVVRPTDRFCGACGQTLTASLPRPQQLPPQPPEETLKVVSGVTWNALEGSRDGSILLTDRRTIFVLEKATATNIAYLMGGVLGAALADARAKKKEVDYARINPDQFAADPDNLVIPHYAVRMVEIKDGMADLKLLIDYVYPDGTAKRLKAAVSPPPDFLKEKRLQGVKQRDAVQEYGQTLRGLFQRALHPR